jgi:hypothetical protein
MAKQIKLSEIVLRQEISSRGGGVEIDLTRFGFKGEKMAAYQNYLGGGILGSIQTNDTIRRESYRKDQTDKVNAKLDKIALRLAKYMHELTNPHTEYEGASFEKRQAMPSSAY